MGKRREVIANYPQLIASFHLGKKTIQEAEKEKKSNKKKPNDYFELLRFYANECGLKARFLDENLLRDTSNLEAATGIKYGYKHDLIRWLDELKVPASEVKRPKPISQTGYRFEQLHETLRYGVTPDEEHAEINKLIHIYLVKNLQ